MHEYSSVVDKILRTNVVGQAWKEMVDEFGDDKRIGAKCSFGKGLFEDKIRSIKPSGVKF